MSEEGQNNSGLEKDKFLLEKTKLFRDHIQGILGLATGSLVLSITFLHDKGNNVSDTSALRYSWIFFCATIVMGVAYNYVLAIHTNRQRPFFRFLLTLFSSLFHGLFLVAVFFLARFGLSNLH